MEKIKVVVRYSDSRLIKGFIEDSFSNKDRFHLAPAKNPSGGPTEASMKELAGSSGGLPIKNKAGKGTDMECIF